MRKVYGISKRLVKNRVNDCNDLPRMATRLRYGRLVALKRTVLMWGKRIFSKEALRHLQTPVKKKNLK